MKRFFASLALVCLLLAGCGKPETPTTAAAIEDPGAALAGVWVNAGQYSEGRDFVETLTLNRDGTAVVHLDYRGKDYATLEGIWTADVDTLSVDFTDPNTKDRTYAYTVTDAALTLTGDGKAVEYVRKSE